MLPDYLAWGMLEVLSVFAWNKNENILVLLLETSGRLQNEANSPL